MTAAWCGTEPAIHILGCTFAAMRDANGPEGRETELRRALSRRILVLDGAMGTMLQRHGLDEAGFRGALLQDHPLPLAGNGDVLSLTRPRIVREVHRAYLDAGADIIETNTFTATSVSQADFGTQHLVREMNRAAARLARDAASEKSAEDPSRPRFVAGAMGPTNKSASLSPDVSDPGFRSITFDALEAAYFEQAAALVQGGVDALLVETVFDTLNAKAALAAALRATRAARRSVPVMVSLTVADRSGRTLGGQTPEAFWISVAHASPLSIGVNCALGAAEMRPYVEALSSVADCFTSCYPNAGLPNAFGEYEETPEHMAALLGEYARSGWLNIVGGCCGTTPEHVRAIAEAVAGLPPRHPPERPRRLALAGLEPYAITPDTNLTVVGERTNITGSPAFAEAIRADDLERAVEIARQQVERGANLLDINMDEGLLDAPATMRRFLNLLAAEPEVARVPFMIDSSDWAVLETGLACVAGKPVINSLSLKDGRDELLRRASIVRDRGAAAVVMAFDEAGQADTLQRKIEVCARAYRLLVDEAGLPAWDIVFDPIVLTVGTGLEAHDRYALDFIEAIRWIKAHLPYALTIGGISNVSFAFRGHRQVREAMHAAFLYHAIHAGLDMAIVNAGMLAVYDDIPERLRERVEDLLFARRPDATDRLIALAQRLRDDPAAARARQAWRGLDVEARIAHALVHGLATNIEADAHEAMTKLASPLAVIEGPLMDGMREVGDLFAAGKMFLPQVVKSARVMKKAVTYLAPYVEQQEPGGAAKAAVVLLATVKGDVHDIGKNIVGVVLACNGFRIVDLGVMVPAERILDEARRHDASIVGLSGLITPSLAEMAHVAQEMERQGFDVPLLIGGAATSRTHTAVRIAPCYGGPTVHVPDASRAVGVVASLLDPAGRTETARATRAEYEVIRARHQAAPDRSLLPLEAARSNRLRIDWSVSDIAVPAFLGVRTIDDASLREIAAFIDWTPFFHAWELRGVHPRILDDPELGPRARELLTDARAFLARSIARGDLEARAVYGFFPANAEGDDIVVYADERRGDVRARIHTLRQQTAARDPGRPNLALADFVAPVASGRLDFVGAFAVSTGFGLEELSVRLEAEADDYGAIMARALADRLAEAFAEMLHARVRREWGYGRDEDLAVDEMLQERYRGIRPAPGYPACPDHSEKRTIWQLLDVERRTGMRLTESCAMWPASTVSGWYLAHVAARYFSVGPVGRDQVEDLAARKGLPIQEVERWLAAQLAYDPARTGAS